MSAVQADSEQQDIIERKQSASDSSSVRKRTTADGFEKGAPQDDVEETKRHSWASYERFRPFILISLALLIFGWWISSIVLRATRHRWFVFRISNLRSRFLSQSHSPDPSSTGLYRPSGHGLSFCESAKISSAAPCVNHTPFTQLARLYPV